MEERLEKKRAAQADYRKRGKELISQRVLCLITDDFIIVKAGGYIGPTGRPRMGESLISQFFNKYLINN